MTWHSRPPFLPPSNALFRSLARRNGKLATSEIRIRQVHYRPSAEPRIIPLVRKKTRDYNRITRIYRITLTSFARPVSFSRLFSTNFSHAALPARASFTREIFIRLLVTLDSLSSREYISVSFFFFLSLVARIS